MKRPFAVIGLTYLSALTAALYIGSSVSFYAAFVLIAAFIITLFIKPLRRGKTVPIICIAAAAALFAYCGAVTYLVNPVQTLDGKECTVTATVTRQPYQNGTRIYYPVQTTKINEENAPQNINLIISAASPIDADCFDSITCDIKFYTSDSESYKNYLSAKGVYISSYTVYGSKVSVTRNDNKPLSYYPIKINRLMSDAIDKLLPPKQASLAKALFLGDKNALESDVRTDFNKAGIGHVIVVSGLHLSVLASFIFLLMRKVTRSTRLSSIVSITAVIAFMAVTGFSPSVIRAGIMMIIFMSGKLFKHPADSLNSLGASAIALTIFNPLAAGDTGLLMSFGATLGIITIYPKLNGFINSELTKIKYGYNAVKNIISALTVSLSAVIITFPISFFSFGTFNIYFLLSNLLITFLVPVVLVCIMAMVVLSFIPFISFLAYPFALIAGVICNYFLFAANAVSSLPFSTIDIDKPFMYFWICATAVILFISLIIGKGTLKHRKTVILLSLSILLLCGGLYNLFTLNSTKITVINTNGGNTIVLEKGGESAIVSCGGSYGSRKETVNKLKEISAQPKLLLIPDQTTASSRYAVNIINNFEPENILIYSSKKYSDSLATELAVCNNISTFGTNYTVSLWDNTMLNIFRQDDSTWINIVCDGNSFLVCPKDGDFDDIPESMLSPVLAIMPEIPKNIVLTDISNILLTAGEDEYAEQTNLPEAADKNIITTLTGDKEITISFNNEVTLWQK